MTASTQPMTLVTKSDIDGMVTAILLQHLTLIQKVIFSSKEAIQEGTQKLSEKTITVNLPFAKGAKHAYDYKLSTDLVINHFHTLDTQATSAAALIFHRYHDNFDDRKFETLVKIANNEAKQTVSTIERIHVYETYKDIFEPTLAVA